MAKEKSLLSICSSLRGNENARFLVSYRVNEKTDCWEWIGFLDKDGYAWFRSNGKNIRAHRYSYEKKYGPIPEGLVLRHKCDNPPCVNPDHTIPGTQKQNIADAMAKGRHVHGFKHHKSKLTPEDILEISSLWIRGFTSRQISKGFLVVGEHAIKSILNGRSRPDLKLNQLEMIYPDDDKVKTWKRTPTGWKSFVMTNQAKRLKEKSWIKINCEVCGTEFEGTKRAMYCSGACAGQAFRNRRAS